MIGGNEKLFAFSLYSSWSPQLGVAGGELCGFGVVLQQSCGIVSVRLTLIFLPDGIGGHTIVSCQYLWYVSGWTKKHDGLYTIKSIVAPVIASGDMGLLGLVQRVT